MVDRTRALMWFPPVLIVLVVVYAAGADAAAVGVAPDGRISGAFGGMRVGGVNRGGFRVRGSQRGVVTAECRVVEVSDGASDPAGEALTASPVHSFHCLAAEFGPDMPRFPGAAGSLVVASPRQGCAAPRSSKFRGAIAVVERGGCSFEAKVGYMQEAGAVAVLVLNNDDGAVFPMPPGGALGRPSVGIPSAMISRRDARALLSALAARRQRARQASTDAGTSDVATDAPHAGTLHIVMASTAADSGMAAAEARLVDDVAARPHDAEAHQALSDIYRASGRVDKAAKHAQVLRRLATVQELRDLDALAQSEPETADAATEQSRPGTESLEFRRRRLELLDTLARQAAADGQVAQAARALHEALDLEPHAQERVKRTAERLDLLAGHLMGMGYVPDAVDVLRRLVQVKPDSASGHRQLGWALLHACQQPVPTNGFGFGSPLSEPDDAEVSPLVGGAVPPPRSFECDVTEALRELEAAGLAEARDGRLQRVESSWETEVDFWGWALGGKEQLYSWASESLKQRLRHDIAQMHHLQALRFKDSYMDPQGVPFSTVASAQSKFLEILETNHGNTPNVLDGVMMLEPHQAMYVAETLGVTTYFPPEDRLGVCGDGALSPCLDPDVDFAAVTKEFRDSDVGLATVDGLLSDTALRSLRRLAEEGTIWLTQREGWVAASLDHGMVSESLLRIAVELRQALPDVICAPLRAVWANKYDNTIVPVSNAEHAAWVAKKAIQTEWRRKHKHAPFDEDQALADFPHAASKIVSRPRAASGTPVHVDNSVVSVTVWVTRDGANANDETGGLVIYRKSPPKEWRLQDYALDRGSDAGTRAHAPSASSHNAAREWLQAHNGLEDAVIVPHRPNRAAIFRGDLFHETDETAFYRGYTNRRTSFTFAFGDPGNSSHKC